MSKTESADRRTKRLILLKEWQDRSIRVTQVIFVVSILIVFAIAAVPGFISGSTFRAFLVDENDPAELREWSSQIPQWEKQARELSPKALLLAATLNLAGLLSFITASLAYGSEKRKTMNSLERTMIIDSLVRRAQSGDYGYHKGVETILRDFNINQWDMEAWPAWQPLVEQEHKEIWGKFRERFEFNFDNTPAIKEPIPSVTYKIKSHKNLQECLLSCLRRLIPESDWVYALDYQYLDEDGYPEDVSYKFYPHIPFKLGPSGEWPIITILRQSVYYVFLHNSFDFGVFLNEKENTMCIFGEKLLLEVDKEKPILFDTVLRTNGSKV